MKRQFLVDIDLSGNQLTNAKLQALATFPSTVGDGFIFYHTGDHTAYMKESTNPNSVSGWLDLGVAASGLLYKSIYDANTVLAATADNDPQPLTITANTVLGRTSGNISALTKADLLAMLNVADGAGVFVGTNVGVGTPTATTIPITSNTGTGSNIPSAVSGSAGLMSSADKAKIDKVIMTDTSSVSGNSWVSTNVSGNSTTTVPTSAAVKTYVDALLGSNDAMLFKGTLGTGGTVTALPTAYNSGWTYKVITAGTYAGIACEVGDMIIAIVDRASAGVNADWTVIQTNIDGAVTGPASSGSGNLSSYNGATGKVIQDSGIAASNVATLSGTQTISGAKTFSTAPVVPTAAVDTSNTNAASTAFVINQGYLKSSSAATSYSALWTTATTTFSILQSTHLRGIYPSVSVKEVSTNAIVECEVIINASGDVTLNSISAVSANAYRVIIK